MSYQQDIALACYFCPICHQSTFGEHWMPEYRDWSKCTGCGYAELKSITKNRAISILYPDTLSERFDDPVTPELINKATTMRMYKESVENNRNSDGSKDATQNDQSDQ